ncbi:MAG: signal peptidase II [Candidatus Eremiobacter antarcticus]|nr:signal peptidase II [Candidatus Eremiobacteraeota bacterium]PZR60861.1 MAG: signal peptidase II [Candidatus Eremiobacter sp. RRmetagenome_bin22]
MLKSAAALALALVTVVADQLSKHAIAADFLPGESRIVIPHILYLTYVQNYHGAFGLFGTHPLLLTAAAATVLIAFYLWYRREGASASVHAAFGLIFGGAIGNIIDRVHFGYVHDFIDLRVWPVFNIADSAITVGVTVLLLQMLVQDQRGAASPPSDELSVAAAVPTVSAEE